MANGTYGITKPANINPSDAQVFYNFKPNRAENGLAYSKFTQIDSTSVLSKVEIDVSDVSDANINGLYNLRLPVEYFSQKGIYTIYIKPKEIKTTIKDVSTLTAYPDIRGVILDSNEIITDGSITLENGGLVGYRIEYFEKNKRQPYYRIVTSSNKAEPVNQNVNDSNQKGVRYRYNESSSLLFLTVTPSSAPNSKPNSLPFIGNVGQEITLVNSKFNPIMIEIEMVENDMDTLSYSLKGNQIRSLDDGLITTYNTDKEIYNQRQVYTLKTQQGLPVFEVIENKESNIDFSQEWNQIVSQE